MNAPGPLAQLVERHVYTVDVVGSIPAGPTNDRSSSLGETWLLGAIFHDVGMHYRIAEYHAIVGIGRLVGGDFEKLPAVLRRRTRKS